MKSFTNYLKEKASKNIERKTISRELIQNKALNKTDLIPKQLKIKGYASVYNIADYHGDVILAGAFAKDIDLFKNSGRKIRLLAHHNTNKPIAKIILLEDREDGLYMEALLKVKDIDPELISQLQTDLVGELSVGMIPKENYHSNGNRFIKEVSLIEISVVTIGANPFAKIIEVEAIY